MKARGVVASRIARGIALFFGLFSLVNGIARLFGARTTLDTWWIDLHVLGAAGGLALLAAATLLIGYTIAPVMAPWRRYFTATAGALLAIAAAVNVVGYFAAVRAGGVNPAVPLPFSVFVALGFAFVTWRMLSPALSATRPSAAWVVSVAVGLAVLFPLAHVLFFGTTDYRRPADAIVVPGARVYANGVLSTSLEDRVRTAAGLYADGLAPRIIMSGGVGESGFDETEAMRTRAIALGVPADAITLDHEGLDTDATVRNTSALFDAEGIKRVLVVSQFYHLPRIKLAYAAAGRDVQTVPATASRPIVQTPMLVVREIPGFWVYWMRATVREITGPE